MCCGGGVSVYTCISMNLCAAFNWVFNHWPQSDRSNIADCMTYKAWKSHVQGYEETPEARTRCTTIVIDCVVVQSLSCV